MIMHNNNNNKVEQYEKVFSHFDENGDGKISPPELRLGLALMGGELSLSEAESAVESMDSDGDGLLEIEDFVRLMDGAGDEEKDKELREAFRMYEMDDGSGSITPKSLKRMLKKLGESMSIEDCKRMIATYDINGDGVLNFHEFKRMMA